MAGSIFGGMPRGLLTKSTMLDLYNRVADDAARRAGFKNHEDRLADAVSKSEAAMWKMEDIRRSLQPREINMHVDNSPEALLAAYEARKRGEIVQYAEEAPAITAEDADFTEVSPAAELWPEGMFDVSKK